MKKVLILFITLISSQNVFSVTLNRINSTRVGINQDDLVKEIHNNRILKYSACGAAALVSGYLAFQYFKKTTPIVFDKDKAIDEVLKLYQEGKILLNQGFLASIKSTTITTVGLQLYGSGLGTMVSGVYSKLFKQFDISSIIQDKTKIILLISTLKKNFAALDNKSPMFDVELPARVTLEANFEDITAGSDKKELLDVIESNLNGFLKNNFEMFQLKTIAAANGNISGLDMDFKIKEVVTLLNELVCDLEKIIAFMQYKTDCYRSENKIEEQNKADQLTLELNSFIENELNKFDKILTQMEDDKKVVDNNGLLSLIFNFEQTFFQIISRLP